MTHAFPGVETPGYKCIVSNETIGRTSDAMFHRNIASIARGFNPW